MCNCRCYCECAEEFDDFDPDTYEITCPECDHEDALSAFADVPHSNPNVCKVRCPECEEVFSLGDGGDAWADHAVRRAESGYAQ